MKKTNKGTSLSKRSFEKLIANRKALIGLVMLIVISVLCFGAPLFSDQDPLAIDIALKYGYDSTPWAAMPPAVTCGAACFTAAGCPLSSAWSVPFWQR